MLDARGHGRSRGVGMDAGWYGTADIAAAVQYLQRLPGVDPARIGLLGLSMGGEEAIGAAGLPGVTAVIAEGATGRTAADKASWLPGGVAGAVQRGIDWVTYQTAATFTGAPQPPTLREAVARAADTSVLLIAAGTVPDETRAAERIRVAAPNHVQIWTVPGAGHTCALRTEPAEWERTVTHFLDRALHSSGAG
jgi:dienelactone hydrolase